MPAPIGTFVLYDVPDPAAGDADFTIYTAPAGNGAIVHNIQIVWDTAAATPLRLLWINFHDDLGALFARFLVEFLHNNASWTYYINQSSHQGGTATQIDGPPTTPTYSLEEVRVMPLWRILPTFTARVHAEDINAGDQMHDIRVYVQEF